MHEKEPGTGTPRPRLRRTHVIALAISALALLLVAVWVKRNLYASKYTPVHLVASEKAELEAKLSWLEGQPHLPAVKRPEPGRSLEPEPYSEEGANREIFLTERELNALVANSPEVAEQVAIDLSDDRISVKLVIPVDDEFPVLGGKRLRFHMGLVVRQEKDRPYVALQGVSLGGIPLPNAWLGYLKNVNLVEEFGTGDGFWKIFAAGVRTVQVRRGQLRILLQE